MQSKETLRVLKELDAQGDDGRVPRSWWDSFEFDNFKRAFRFLKNRVTSGANPSVLVDTDNQKIIIRLLSFQAPREWTTDKERDILILADIHGAKYLGWRCATVPKESETP